MDTFEWYVLSNPTAPLVVYRRTDGGLIVRRRGRRRLIPLPEIDCQHCARPKAMPTSRSIRLSKRTKVGKRVWNHEPRLFETPEIAVQRDLAYVLNSLYSSQPG